MPKSARKVTKGRFERRIAIGKSRATRPVGSPATIGGFAIVGDYDTVKYKTAKGGIRTYKLTEANVFESANRALAQVPVSISME